MTELRVQRHEVDGYEIHGMAEAMIKIDDDILAGVALAGAAAMEAAAPMADSFYDMKTTTLAGKPAELKDTPARSRWW